jgi:hypothetical protein
MNRKSLLLQRHTFRNGDKVQVNYRNKPDEKYDGTIYAIIDNYDSYYKMNIDYFYITFEKKVYDKLLQTGWKVIHNGMENTLGNIERNEVGEITKIYIQSEYLRSYETAIKIENIYGILIWRDGYNIERT